MFTNMHNFQNPQPVKKPFPYRLLTTLLLAALFFVHSAATNGQNLEKSVFWEITGKGMKKPSYLFGTYHVVNASYLDEVPKVKQAFSGADQVTVEMVLDSSKLQAMGIMALMPDKKLSGMISKEDYDLVAEEVKAIMGVDLAMFDQLKPISISVLLTLMYIRQDQAEMLAKYTGAPLDIYFASEGKSKGKKVNTFETMEEQMKILYDGETPEKQAEHLVAFVKSKDEMKATQKELTDHYFNGNLNAMYALSEKYADEMGDLTYILDDRNVRWMEMLPGLLKDGSQFVAVGALHLTGKKGLITMLRSAGYTVKPLALK